MKKTSVMKWYYDGVRYDKAEELVKMNNAVCDLGDEDAMVDWISVFPHKADFDTLYDYLRGDGNTFYEEAVSMFNWIKEEYDY